MSGRAVMSQGSMRKRGRPEILKLSRLLIVFVIVVLASCGKPPLDAGGKPGDRRAELKKRMEERPVPVAVAQVTRGRIDAFYSSTTTLTAEEEASVVARTQGVVEKIYVEEGDRVTAGEPLAQLDTKELELQVAVTRTNIESLKRAYERASQLFKTKMISPDAYDKAKFDLEKEQATLALQLHNLNEATIRAPIDGTITVRHIKLGNTLQPNSPAFEIKRSDWLEAILNVPEKELSRLEIGQLARVRVDALAGATFDGKVSRISPQIDPASGTFRVTVKLDNPQGRLKPGMFARVDVRYDSNENALLVARDAVVTQQDQSSVFVVKDGKAIRQVIHTGYTSGDQVEVTKGLAQGDEVVVTGQAGLRDGTAVRVVPI